MPLTRVIASFVAGPLMACHPPPATEPGPCTESPTAGEASHSEMRLATHQDSATALRGIAPLVFRIRPAVPTNRQARIAHPAVVLQDTLTPHLAPLGSVGDSSGFAVVHVPVGYTSARVQRIGYATYTVPLTVRPGYSDTIIVALARNRVCIVE